MLKRIESPLYTVAQIREMEDALFAHKDSFAVMQDAAQSLFDVIAADFPRPTAEQTVHIVLGAGNNAGDGLVVAVLLQKRGFCVRAYAVFERAFHGDATKALTLAQAAKIDIQPFYAFHSQAEDIIIEAIFGIGLDRPAEGSAKTAIEHINACKTQHPSITVYAVDVPAGIAADTGAALGATILADKTVTFIGDKIGLRTADGKGYAGEIVVCDLGAKIPSTLRLQKGENYRYHYQTPKLAAHHNTHKGDYGHALIIGGGQGMFGAAALASVSALKVGTGKASVYSHPDYASQFHLNGTPLYEVMRKADLVDLSAYSALVLGVGLGRDDWGKATFEQILHVSNQPLLIDADGLWYLAEPQTRANISVITPHEAEAARLLKTTAKHIRQHKPQAVRELAQRFNCVTVLKGAGTLISDGDNVWINDSGNVCLATAGTGDVLAGMIGGYLAQGFTALDAALYGVYRHGLAADNYLAQHGEKALRASDLWASIYSVESYTS